MEHYRNGTHPVGKLHFQLDHRQIEVIRYFDAGTAVIWDLSGTEPTCVSAGEDEKGFKSELSRLLGFHDEEVAYGTTFVRNGDMGTRLGDKMKHALAHAKRAGYQRVVTTLKPQLASLDDAAASVQRELAERTSVRQRADEALRQAMTLEAEAEALDEELQAKTEEFATETGTQTALGTLEGHLAELRTLEGHIADAEGAREKVEGLQAELADANQKIATEHAPLVAMEVTFMADVDALEAHRSELAGVQAEVDAINTRRVQVQGEMQKLTVDVNTTFGEYKDLPDNFPSLLELYPTRRAEWDKVTAALESVDASLAAQHGVVDQNFARFKPFDDMYEYQLRDLDMQERYWRQQLADLDADMARCRAAGADIAQTEHNLQHDFGAFAGLARDFRSRVRNWHRVWEELKGRRGPVNQAQEEIDAIQAALERIGRGDRPEAWAEALADKARLEGQQSALTAERDELSRLHDERRKLLRRVDLEFAHLKDKAQPDFPDKLREHVALRQELKEQSTLLEEARQRLQAAEAVVINRFDRFRQDADWGRRLEQHRQMVEKSQATLDRLKHEEQQIDKVLQALAAEGDDGFLQALREYAGRKARLRARDGEQADFAARYQDFAAAPPDLGDRLATWQADRENLPALARQIADAQQSVAGHNKRLEAIETKLEEYATYKDKTDDLQGLMSALTAKQARQKELAAQVKAEESRHKELKSEKGKGNKLGALLGRGVTAKDLNSQESRVTSLKLQLADVEGQVKKAKQALGAVAGGDLSIVEKDLKAIRRLQEERSGVQEERQTATASLASLQAQETSLQDRLGPLSEQFHLATEADAQALQERFRTYQEAKGHLGTMAEEESRLAEAEAAVRKFAARFNGDPAGVTAVAEKVLAHHDKPAGERGDLKGEVTQLQRKTRRGMAEDAERIGLVAGESLEQLESEWHDYQHLQRQMEADEAVVKAPEGQTGRIAEVTARLEALGAELGVLVAHPDVEALVGEINTYLELLPRLQELEAALATRTPLDVAESRAATAQRELRGLTMLGVKSGIAPEPVLADWKKAADRLQARQTSLSRVLEVDARDGSTVLDRLQKRLDEMAAGLGGFTELADLDATLRRYDEYLAATVKLEGLKKTLEVMPAGEELQANHAVVAAELDEARGKLGLLPGENLSKVKDLYGIYRDLRERLQKSVEERNRLLSSLSIGDRSGAESGPVLDELKAALDSLRQSLGGFEEAGEGAEEVILEFKATQELKARIRSLSATLDQMRRPDDLDAWTESMRAPIRSLEEKLTPVGDPADVPALRARFVALAELRQTVAGLQERLAEHAALPALSDTKEQLAARTQEVRGLIRTLLEQEGGLARWHETFSEKPDALRPAIESHLAEVEAQRAALADKTSETWGHLRQHNQERAGDLLNLAALDRELEELRQREARVVEERDGLKRGLDILAHHLEHATDLLGGGLQVRTQDVLKSLTGGRWAEVAVEGKPLEPVLKTPHGERRGDHVFGGLRDQLYFALRVAMADELSGSIQLPFLIDDPFLRLDPQQLPLAIEYLRQLGSRRQVILFTHDERFKELGPVMWDFTATGARSMTQV
ncbi:MAG TPA: hypothetical protein VGO93_29370 [Candidatus Xenobia bacterium]